MKNDIRILIWLGDWCIHYSPRNVRQFSLEFTSFDDWRGYPRFSLSLGRLSISANDMPF